MSILRICCDIPTQTYVEFTENDLKRGKYPVSSSSANPLPPQESYGGLKTGDIALENFAKNFISCKCSH